jgi:hypothetical protein
MSTSLSEIMRNMTRKLAPVWIVEDALSNQTNKENETINNVNGPSRTEKIQIYL